MKMIPEQNLGQLLSLFGLFLAVNLEASSIRPPDRDDNTYNTTVFAKLTTPASKPSWKGTAATTVFRRSNHSMPATTQVSKPSSVITTEVKHNSTQNGPRTSTPSWDAMFATTASSNITVSSNSTHDTQGLVDSELPLRPTNLSQITKLTTVTTPAVNAAPLPVATVKATDPPPTTPITQRAKAAGNVVPRDKPRLAATPGPSNTLPTTLGLPFKLRQSTQTMTVIFSSLLGVTALVIFLYTLDRCKQKKTQYLHQPLYNNSEETADRFVPADDTLVISGGLYDGPRVYNPTMTTANEDEDFHCDQPSASRSTQFQLKLLKEERGKPPSYEASTDQTSQRMVQDA